MAANNFTWEYAGCAIPVTLSISPTINPPTTAPQNEPTPPMTITTKDCTSNDDTEHLDAIGWVIQKSEIDCTFAPFRHGHPLRDTAEMDAHRLDNDDPQAECDEDLIFARAFVENWILASFPWGHRSHDGLTLGNTAKPGTGVETRSSGYSAGSKAFAASSVASINSTR